VAHRPVLIVVEGDWALSAETRGLLLEGGFEIRDAASEPDVDRLVSRGGSMVLLVGANGGAPRRSLDLIRRVHESHGSVPIVAAARNSSEELAVAVFRAGACDYLRDPIATRDCVTAIWRAIAPRHVAAEVSEPVRLVGGEQLIGASPAARALQAKLLRVAATHANVLITGETGTGKELAARLLHANSPRRHKPFVSINCAAIPDGLLESELFGYEKGAFTGAQGTYAGKLQLAHDGTTLFDEIGDMSLAAQAKILRAIETKEVYRLGGTRRNAVDIRMIAATNQNLEKLVSEGRFRKDLFFRLNVVRIHLPALRERREDIPLLLDYYVHATSREFRRHVDGFCAAAVKRLTRYDWPGNIRELKNVVEAVFVNLPAHPVKWLDLPELVQDSATSAPDLERDQLLSALLETNWNKSRAAERLSWSRMTVYRKMAKYHLRKEDSAPLIAVNS
jgi:DNA-binding NtrC family response regulator